MADAWTEDFERTCEALVDAVVSSAGADRVRAWRELMGRVGPHVEQWAARSYVLRRSGLASPDDARSVLVGVLDRLQANQFENLRRFRARLVVDDAVDRAETATLTSLLRIVDPDDEPARDAPTGTPLRAWLLQLVTFAAKDHVRHRLGWTKPEPDADGRIASKRDVHTNAARLPDHDDRGARPPLTDFVGLKRFLDEVHAFIATFPADQRGALTMWLQEASADEIATAVGVAPASVPALVRAAKARLRERFRGDLDRLHGIDW